MYLPQKDSDERSWCVGVRNLLFWLDLQPGFQSSDAYLVSHREFWQTEKTQHLKTWTFSERTQSLLLCCHHSVSVYCWTSTIWDCGCIPAWAVQVHKHDVVGQIFLTVSSANEWWRIEWCSITPERDVVYKTNRTGPRTDPEEHLKKQEQDQTSSCWWRQFLSSVGQVWGEPLQCSTVYIPKTFSRWLSKLLWSVVPNAAKRSRNVTTEMFPLSREFKRLLTIFKRAVSVLCPGS